MSTGLKWPGRGRAAKTKREVEGMKKQLEVRIYPDGKIEASTVGITGKSCANYRALLEKLMEAKTTAISYTDDYYADENQLEQEVQEELKL